MLHLRPHHHLTSGEIAVKCLSKKITSISHLRLSIGSVNSGEGMAIVSVQHIVAGDVLVEQRAALHHDPVHRLTTRELHLDVLVLVLSRWVPATSWVWMVEKMWVEYVL